MYIKARTLYPKIYENYTFLLNSYHIKKFIFRKTEREVYLGLKRNVTQSNWRRNLEKNVKKETGNKREKKIEVLCRNL